MAKRRRKATLSVAGHTGVIAHRPNELVLTARAGTPLAHIERLLDSHRQMLPFDPPQFGGQGTFGGAIATGLTGPARPWRGGARDSVLGVEIVNGMGERLRFGGSVIKNVAGYDVSRLLTGAFGTLGVILSASVRLLPKPEAEQTLVRECDAARAGRWLRAWSRWPLPITATCFESGLLRVRVSGARTAIADAATELGMPMRDPDPTFWQRVRDHDHPWFDGDAPADTHRHPTRHPLRARRRLDRVGRQSGVAAGRQRRRSSGGARSELSTGRAHCGVESRPCALHAAHQKRL